MAPDRGHDRVQDELRPSEDDRSGFNAENRPRTSSTPDEPSAHDAAQQRIAERASQPQNFTVRGVLLGLFIGLIIAFSNTYFGLQTGWVSGMSMPSALIAFAFFKVLGPYLKLPFSPVENVLVQTVAGSVGTMPLGCGFVGVIPALEYLLNKDENGPLDIGVGRLVLWAVGVCLFGVVIAVPLRNEVIIREKLKFPSGTATALMIGVLHGDEKDALAVKQEEPQNTSRARSHDNEQQRLMDQGDERGEQERPRDDPGEGDAQAGMQRTTSRNPAADDSAAWKAKILSLMLAFAGSGIYTVVTYFIPQLRNIPILGAYLAREWLWTLNPSPAYIGQGIIMGPATTAHMLLGAVIGWGILSPLAKSKGWAPGPVHDWETGSKGWIVWVSLAIMLADALVSLGWLITRPTIYYARIYGPPILARTRNGDWQGLKGIFGPSTTSKGYAPINTSQHTALKPSPSNSSSSSSSDTPEPDAPPSQLITRRTFLLSLLISTTLYFASIHLTFPSLIPFTLSLLALLLAFFLSLLGVRALGETDLNPVSGISKLTQLIFAFVVPSSNPNAVVINLLAGAVSESGALQAGDLMQDLKTGHLLGASPAAQFWGQIIGSVVGAAASAVIYKLYAHVYTIPSRQFQIPTAYVWVFTARLVTGEGIPAMAAPYAFAFAGVWAVLTVARLVAKGRSWAPYIPGGIAVAVGMYNTPNFTIARAVGGFVAWWWTRWKGRGETGVIVLASGLILGEGLCSIVNLALASAGVPHLGDDG